MNTPLPSSPPVRSGPSRWKLMFWLLLVPVMLAALYFALVLNWNYADGERAGYVQKFSRKGWLCKTWEGEIVLVTMPGAIPEKFPFTVWDDATADSLNKVMGKRVTVHYEQKVGLPTTCFGETRYIVTRVVGVDDIPLMPGLVVPTPPANTAPPPTVPATPETPTTPTTQTSPTTPTSPTTETTPTTPTMPSTPTTPTSPSAPAQSPPK